MNRTLRFIVAACVVLLAAGCAAPITRTPAEDPVDHTEPAPAPIVNDEVAAAPQPPASTEFWQALREDFRFVDCAADDAVKPWLQRFERQRRGITESLRAALPEIVYVAGIVREADLPAEFTLLPWVESGYRYLSARGEGPAGMWQITAATARSHGLRIEPGYDARLDLDRASRAAAKLLQSDHAALGDWRLATMAYNTGSYRMKKLMRDRAVPPGAVPDLPVSATTREHLAKLSAIACIVQQPEQHGFTLPDASGIEPIRAVTLTTPMPLALVARIADVDEDELHRRNPAWVDRHRAGRALLLPASAAHLLATRDAQFARRGWENWHAVVALRDIAVPEFGADPATHAALSLYAEVGATLPRGSEIWLPEAVANALPTDALRRSSARAAMHRVVAGDSLWALARRYQVAASDLKRWNKLTGDRLRIGQELRLSAPHRIAAAVGEGAP